jgi:biopolymer transport protein ExbD
MAGGSSGYQSDDGGPGAICDINVTPLVDVVLVLLIIFMVTAKLIAERGIAVETPRTASGGPVDASLALTIDRERVLYIDGTPVPDLDSARRQVTAARARNPEIKAVISADVSVPHGEVMKAIDLVKLAGITRFALASQPLAEEERD